MKTQWMVGGTCIYLLQPTEDGRRMENRWTMFLQGGPGTTPDEAETTAARIVDTLNLATIRHDDW